MQSLQNYFLRFAVSRSCYGSRSVRNGIGTLVQIHDRPTGGIGGGLRRGKFSRVVHTLFVGTSVALGELVEFHVVQVLVEIALSDQFPMNTDSLDLALVEEIHAVAGANG